MGIFHDLFLNQSKVAIEIERCMEENHMNKRELSTNAGVSRPTLDKILSGDISSEVNYTKHIEKILRVFDLKAEVLLGRSQGVKNRVKALCQMLRLKKEEVAEQTGIGIERLAEIEAGSEPTTAELRDIALCFGTSTLSVEGTNIFAGQTAMLSDYSSRKPKELSGFIGHIGILPKNMKKYRWYPITKQEWENYCNAAVNQYILVPCMENKILFLNMEHINRVVLLPAASDVSKVRDWNPEAGEGDTALVLYEALSDYYYADDESQCSRHFKEMLERYIKAYHWTEEKLREMVYDTRILYSDGFEESSSIRFEKNKVFCNDMGMVYDYYARLEPSARMMLTDDNEAVMFLNLENIAMMEMPYLRLEKAIREVWKEEERTTI